MTGRWMDSQEHAIKDLASQIAALEARTMARITGLETKVGEMAAKLDRQDLVVERLEGIANSLDGLHQASDLLNRGRKWWGGLAATFVSLWLVVSWLADHLPPLRWPF